MFGLQLVDTFMHPRMYQIVRDILDHRGAGIQRLVDGVDVVFCLEGDNRQEAQADCDDKLHEVLGALAVPATITYVELFDPKEVDAVLGPL